jgi:inner membrane protein
MSPETHLIGSWIIGAKATSNLRDCRLVALAGILPDADGLGLLVDWFTQWRGGFQTSLYAEYHHWVLHGAFGALLVTTVLTAFAKDRARVAVLALLVFHLHLLCDLLGSRGPSVQDVWPIYYFGPFSHNHMWLWKGQWRLDGWQNRYFSTALTLWALWIAAHVGHSFVGVFSRKLDAVFSGVLVKWCRQMPTGKPPVANV